MEKKLLSFRDFLKTGTLGPIKPGLRMIDVARILGTPDSWITEHVETIPVYWIYGPLEVSFGNDPPHDLHWFQIEHPNSIRKTTERVNDQFALAMEELGGSAKLSDFLQAALWNLQDVRIHYANFGNHQFMLDLCVGTVQMFFEVDTSLIENEDIDRFLAHTPIAKLICEIDQRTEVNSVYSYAYSAEEAPRIDLRWQTITGSAYLSCLQEKEKEAAQAP